MPIPIPGRVAEILRRSTVQVRRSSGQQGSGSGTVVHGGRIVTNAHVVGDSRQVTVESWEGRSASAEVVTVDARRDLALLAVSTLELTALVLGDSDRLRAGTPVLAVGNPMGFTGAASSGVVHAATARWIEADVHLAPGNSGGPLANLHAEVLGINTMVMARGGGRGLALAIPSRSVQAFLARGGTRKMLGVTVRQLSLPGRGTALLLLELTPGGPADQASLLAGDLLTAIDGRVIRSADDLQDGIDNSGETLRVQFYRGGWGLRNGAVREVTVRLRTERATYAA